MKLRELVANSLPRVRGKKKKNQTQKTLNNERYDSNHNKNKTPAGSTSPWESVCGNNNISTGGICEYALHQAVKTACGEIIDTFNFRVNSSLVEDKFSSYGDYIPYESNEEFEKQNDSVIERNETEKQYNTVPKTRSRIRTNPWLPSPRTAPSNTSSGSCSSCSPCSSHSTSPLTSPDNNLVSFGFKDNSSATSSDSLMETDQSAASPEPNDGDVTSNSAGTLERDKWSGQLDLSNINDLNSVWDTDVSNDLSPCIEACEENFGEIEHNISFEYEEALDNTLEKESVKRDVSVQDLHDHESLKDAAVQTEFDEYYEDSDWFLEASSDDGNGELITDDSSKYCFVRDCMQDSTDTGYSSLGRDGQTEVDEEFQYIKIRHLEANVEISQEEEENISSLLDNSGEKVPSSAQLEEYSRPGTDYITQKYPEETSGRTLHDIRSSLEEKVFQLREEKRIVEQKIKDAQEEERIRKQEKLRFHQQLNIHRKQILLKTLHDLKERLEGQSDRLQNSYSAVLTMQKRFAQRRSPLVLLAASTT